MRTSALISMIGAALLGCASTASDLQRATAFFLGGDVNESQVSVTDVERGSAAVRWKAIAPTGSYDCSADEHLQRVQCVNLEQRPVLQQPGSQGPAGPAASSPRPAPAQSAEPGSAMSRMGIKEAQLILNRLGFKAGKADGRLGPRTSNALKAFQHAKGLEQTGQLDPATERALRR